MNVQLHTHTRNAKLLNNDSKFLQFFIYHLANGVPDDDAELIPGQAQPSPSYPAYPSYPTYPVVPSIPSIPTVPVYPSYPTYPTTYGYFPFGWTYNILDNFSSEFLIRNCLQ